MAPTLTSLIEAEFRRYKSLGEGALAQMEPAELSADPGGANSAATIVWHLAGNLESRFTDFLTTDGEKPWRDRESEFDPRDVPRDALLEKWERGWSVLFAALDGLSEADLLRTISVRGVPHRVDQALLRSLTHTSYHVGQIVHLAKRARGEGWRSLSIPRGMSATYESRSPYDQRPGAGA